MGLTLGFFTDLHLRGPRQTPVWRTGSFEDDMLNKLAAMRNSYEDEVDIWLFGGDFVHGPSISVRSVNKAVDVLDGLPLVGAFGQHDTYGHDPKQVEASTASILERAFPQGFDHTSPIWQCEINGLVIAVVNHHEGAEACLTSGAIRNVDVVVAHAMVTEEEVPWDHILRADVEVGSSVQCVFTGDYHRGYPPFETEAGTTIVNPGALSRNTITEANRTPQIALFEIGGNGGSCVYKPVEHRTAAEAFDLDGFEQVKEKSARRGEFARRLEEMEHTGVDAWEKLFQAIDDTDIDPEIKEEAYRRCQTQAEKS